MSKPKIWQILTKKITVNFHRNIVISAIEKVTLD